MTNEELNELEYWGPRALDTQKFYALIAAAKENSRLAAKLESIAGALADSGIDFKTTDAAEAVRELTRERDWYGLLARAANTPTRVCWADEDGGWVAWGPRMKDVIEPHSIIDGLPVETEPLRTALLAALGEPTNAGQSGEREPRLVERETRQPPIT